MAGECLLVVGEPTSSTRSLFAGRQSLVARELTRIVQRTVFELAVAIFLTAPDYEFPELLTEAEEEEEECSWLRANLNKGFGLVERRARTASTGN